jgi:hypothetical protein
MTQLFPDVRQGDRLTGGASPGHRRSSLHNGTLPAVASTSRASPSVLRHLAGPADLRPGHAAQALLGRA